MDAKQKSTEDEEELTFQLEEGLVEDLKESDMTIQQAEDIIGMLEDNAGSLIVGPLTYVAGGVCSRKGYDDLFFQVHYYNPKGEIPTYYIYEDTDCDTYLDHILDQTNLLDYGRII